MGEKLCKDKEKTRILEKIKQEDEHLKKILRIQTVTDFNRFNQSGFIADLINACEALQEKAIFSIADDIACRKSKDNRLKVVLIAGPSSSGKTTFCKRLRIALMTDEIWPMSLSLDDYFVDREKTPLDEYGNYDFETIEALDLPFLNEQLSNLLAGKEIDVPRFNFKTGHREFTGGKLQLPDNAILIMEGIHALNPLLTAQIPDDCKFHVYVAPLTGICLDETTSIPTADNRLLRRILRDYQFRGYSAQQTISQWASVQKGERRWITPFIDKADAMFNSSQIFELAVIRNFVLPILQQVPTDALEYVDARRLIGFISQIDAVCDKDLPSNSLLREFIGGSNFHY
ncbi:MAG: nucleoside kinase [Bacteroidales bacterium]|nr:nucleoside kinase [Bacteroidales bacterium]